MIADALILAESQSVKILRGLGGTIAFAVFVALVALFIICIYRAAEYLGSAKKEQKLLRIEMGKLAEEVHQLRKEFKESIEEDRAAQSQ